MKEKIKEKLTLRWIVTMLTGVLLAVYTAYNAYILLWERSTMTTEEKFFCLIVTLLFGMLALFMWTSELRSVLLLKVRRPMFIIAVAGLFALKLRLVEAVIAYLNFSKPRTVLYGAAYFLTMVGLLVICVFYAFILKNRPLYPRMSIVFPLVAALMFLGALAVEALLFFKYHVGMEPSVLRTVVIRPVLYLGCIGMSVHFLFPPKSSEAELAAMRLTEAEGEEVQTDDMLVT